LFYKRESEKIKTCNLFYDPFDFEKILKKRYNVLLVSISESLMEHLLIWILRKQKPIFTDTILINNGIPGENGQLACVVA
jgi:hypothetical protein